MSIKLRLTVMIFLQFAVWGSYLTCIGNYLGAAGLGDYIAWFYSVQGIVSIFMPALLGILADRYIPAEKLLGMSHGLAALFMLATWFYGYTHPEGLLFAPFFTLYTLSVAFYMPTIALSNTVAFSVLSCHGYSTIKDFPPIRVWGTVGFIAAMWFVNFAHITEGGWLGFSAEAANRFQYTSMQLLVCGILGLSLALYSFTLPNCPISVSKGKKSLVETLGLNAFALFKQRKMALFFIFSMLLGVSLQITNGYATPFITSFKGMPEFASTLGANNATALTSLSQISEALCILLIPFFLRRFGIKKVMLIAMFAWVLRFGFFGLGNPGGSLWMFVCSMLVYGVAFDFFNVSGALFVEKETDKSIQGSAQGLFMLMTNGIGATVGMLAAGAVVKHFCTWQTIVTEKGSELFLLGNWHATWLIFAGYALVVTIAFALVFKYKHDPSKI
ncbi:MAG: MFS transporter [Alistipes sp.]